MVLYNVPGQDSLHFLVFARSTFRTSRKNVGVRNHCEHDASAFCADGEALMVTCFKPIPHRAAASLVCWKGMQISFQG